MVPASILGAARSPGGHRRSNQAAGPPGASLATDPPAPDLLGIGPPATRCPSPGEDATVARLEGSRC